MFKVNNNFEHGLHLFSKVSIINFEQVNAGWDIPTENIRKTLEGIRE